MCVPPTAEHQSDVTGVAWDGKNQAWVALWYEKGNPKQKRKDFYVKDHGFDRAKVHMTTPPIPCVSL